MPPAFVGAFTIVCEMVIDVVSVTVCGALAFGGTELAMRKASIPPILGIDIGGVEMVFGDVGVVLNAHFLTPPLPVLLLFGAGSP